MAQNRAQKEFSLDSKGFVKFSAEVSSVLLIKPSRAVGFSKWARLWETFEETLKIFDVDTDIDGIKVPAGFSCWATFTLDDEDVSKLALTSLRGYGEKQGDRYRVEAYRAGAKMAARKVRPDCWDIRKSVP